MKVIIIGAGITGPLLAMVLKHKAFEVVVYEKHASPPSGGLSMNLSPQVFKVLNIVGLAQEALALGQSPDRLVHRSEVTGELLQDIEVHDRVLEMTGWPMCIVIRAKYCQFLVHKAEERGIPIHWGKKLVDFKQEGEKVTAVFEDGTTDKADLLVGCDGLHSKVRDVLFGETHAEYTGIVVVGGFSPYTDDLHPTGPYAMEQVWGRGSLFLSIPTGDNKWFWAVNQPQEAELLEDWRAAGKEEINDMLASLPQVHWSGNTGKIITSSQEIVRFGLYLRPIPQVWHKGRAVLLGDAAHPTTPFLGQGANMSTEDIYHLVRVLVQNQPLTNESIDKGLSEYTAVRLPKVTKAIAQSKREAEYRKASTDKEVKERDEMRKQGLNSETWKVISEMLNGPFSGESEI